VPGVWPVAAADSRPPSDPASASRQSPGQPGPLWAYQHPARRRMGRVGTWAGATHRTRSSAFRSSQKEGEGFKPETKTGRRTAEKAVIRNTSSTTRAARLCEPNDEVRNLGGIRIRLFWRCCSSMYACSRDRNPDCRERRCDGCQRAHHNARTPLGFMNALAASFGAQHADGGRAILARVWKTYLEILHPS